MAARATAMGGIHIHKFCGLSVKCTGNPYRLAELAMDKLHRKSQICYLHMLLTMDVLVFDEIGQLSAELLTIIDIILRKLRNSAIPFGGVLIIGTMDHTQFGAIDGLPLYLSSHLLTDFSLVRLDQSVRAHMDPDFQRIQAIARYTPSYLLSSVSTRTPWKSIEDEFKWLLQNKLTFVSN